MSEPDIVQVLRRFAKQHEDGHPDSDTWVAAQFALTAANEIERLRMALLHEMTKREDALDRCDRLLTKLEQRAADACRFDPQQTYDDNGGPTLADCAAKFRWPP